MPHAYSDGMLPERPLKPAMLRGALGRCPSCGQGRLFQGYLSVSPACPHCGEELHHQRADDGPAYLTILLVSHLGAPLLLAIFMMYRPSAMSMLIGFGLARWCCRCCSCRGSRAVWSASNGRGACTVSVPDPP